HVSKGLTPAFRFAKKLKEPFLFGSSVATTRYFDHHLASKRDRMNDFINRLIRNAKLESQQRRCRERDSFGAFDLKVQVRHETPRELAFSSFQRTGRSPTKLQLLRRARASAHESPRPAWS